MARRSSPLKTIKSHFALSHDIPVAKSPWSPLTWIRLLALAGVVGGGCSDKMVNCDPPSEVIVLRIPGGTSSLSAVAVSGDCSIDGPPTSCQPERPSCDADPCTCDVSVDLRVAATSTHCHIGVTSATNTMFEVDVPLRYLAAGSGSCAAAVVGPVDVNQWTITVAFSDGGVADGAATPGE
jgi:hypothetical protein